VETIPVRLILTPRLLADLIAASLIRPPLVQWQPGDPPAPVAIVNEGYGVVGGSRVTIGLSDRLDDGISVHIDGMRVSLEPTMPRQLHDLVLALAHTDSVDVVGR
jgi:hypothetical protein